MSASPTPGTIVPAPLTFIEVTFNEAVDPASVQPSDLTLSRGTVSGAEVVAGSGNRTVRFSLSGLTTPGLLTVTLTAGTVADGFGNPGPATAFTAQYGLNTTNTVFPVSLTPLAPLGSLAYTGFTNGALATVSELDPYSLSVDAGQTVTVVVTPGGSGGGFTEEGGEVGSGEVSSLQPTIELKNPSGVVVATAVAPAAGQQAVLQLGPAATLGTYTITVGAAAGADVYSLVVYLNAMAEAEAFGGPANNTRATAQDINPAFLGLQSGTPAQRTAVRGQLTTATGDDFYALNLTAGQPVNLTLGLTNFTAPTSFSATRTDLPTPTGTYPIFVGYRDLNGDGKQDMVAAINPPSNIGGSIGVRLGNGNGTFGTPLTFSTGTNPNAATVADVNGDGLLDISSADAASNSVSIRLSTTPSIRVELQDAAGNVVAGATRGATNFDQGLSFTPAASGIYYARVFGAAATANYTLVATRAAAFDAEPNNSTPATAQNLTGAAGVLGTVASVSTGGSTVPNANATTEGDFSNSFPFNIGAFGIPSMRYQQIYAASQFSAAGIIDAIRFRQDSATGPNGFGPVTLNLKVTLSYAARSPSNASAVFADNIGAGAVTVFDGLTTISSGPASGNARPFDIILDVANLFRYDPAQGDLLVDISMRNAPSFFVAFDAVATNATGITTRIYQTDVNATTGQGPFVSGLVTWFDMFQADLDWYAVDLAAGQRVQLTTTTPAGGPGEFVNTLNPRIELFDAAGTLMASGTPLLDGRNEAIAFTASAAGTYRVRVAGESNSTGEYFLGVNFNPVAANDTATTTEDTPVAIAVLANDTDDVAVDPTTLAIVTGPAHGGLSVSP
ncbi:MAG TPA: FG-GAP-like repeat-containing protein, partial [Gemmataceae bacterium]|nr:FG-GAP-like repeat-containing protein [Gemmataceae bacterium]